MSQAVADAYNRDPEIEWLRLVRDAYQAFEFEVSWDALTRLLPPGAHVLDAGGGPGRYSLALCRAGRRVTLFDLSAGLLEKAQANFAAEAPEVQARLEGVEQGDLRDLSRYAEGSFDAAICLGAPLTHIPEAEGRRRAVQELGRVVRPGGLVFLTGVGFIAVLRVMLEDQCDLVDPLFEGFWKTGNIWGATGTIWHFFRAEELRRLGEEGGLATVELRGCQGLSANLAEATNRLKEERPDMWRVWHEAVLRTSADPTLADISEHILWVGRKP